MNEPIDFRYIRVEDTFVVWLAEANRFLQLKEPAFFVLDQWAQSKLLPEITASCSARYDLPETEAKRFVNEIVNSLDKLFQEQQKTKQDFSAYRKDTERQSRSLSPPVLSEVEASLPQKITCEINNKTIRFMYDNQEVEGLFRLLFRQFEVSTKGTGHGAKSMEHRAWSIEHGAKSKGLRAQGKEQRVKSMAPIESGWSIGHGAKSKELRAQGKEHGDHEETTVNTIELFKEKEHYCFSVNGSETRKFDHDDVEHYQGAVLLEFLNILHDKNREDWMGIFHASAVSDGKDALLFLAESGSGKSTLAALMMAHGYQLLSDDFVPIALESPGVYPFPTAISIKKNAIPVLKNYFPSLTEEEAIVENADWEVFLPLKEGSFTSSAVNAKAIVLVQYGPVAEFRLVRESNLTTMNTILKQSWIANNPEASERFLNWYFSLPVYSLVYSDSGKAVEGIRSIFEK